MNSRFLLPIRLAAPLIVMALSTISMIGGCAPGSTAPKMTLVQKGMSIPQMEKAIAPTSWLRWEFLPPHSANRHDVGCRGAGADRVAAVTIYGLAVRLCFSVAEQTDRTYAELQERR